MDPPIRNSIRHRIDAALPSDAELNAFCMDFFPQIRRKWGDGMDRLQKVNLLLADAEPAEIEKCLQQWERMYLAVLPVMKRQGPHLRWMLLAAFCGATLVSSGVYFFLILPKYSPAAGPRPNLDASLKAADDFVTSRLNRGLSLLRQGDAKSALPEFDAVLNRVPEHAAALQGRGGAFLVLDDAKSAATDLEALVRLAPSNASAWWMLGQARLRINQARAAEQAFCKASQLGRTEARPLCPD